MTVICDGATGAGTKPHWAADDLSHVIGVHTIGTSCAGSQSMTMSISTDDYLIYREPADGSGLDPICGGRIDLADLPSMISRHPDR